MELRLLGPIELIGPGGPVDLGGARPTRLLVALFTADRHRLDLDALVERCFDDADRPDDAVPAIRTAVRRLRRALGDDAVATRTGGYELDPSTIDADVDRFEELIAAGRATADPVAAVTSFRRALDLWQGRPFGELGDADWLVTEQVRLAAAHLTAIEGWHDAHLRNGTVTEIIPSLESATLEHPLRERFHRQLMQALFVADRQADALRAFQTYRESMLEAGLEPGPEAVALERRIATGDPALLASTEGRPLRGYRIAERLGEGAFSIVYRGTQPSVEREVAIKQIRAELANRPDFIRRFEAEAHMVAHLEHPHIVPLYDYWREPGSAYLVMRLLAGGSLESSLLDGPWDLDRTGRMVSQIGAALSVAHRAGIVHRDVKSANILLDDEGNSYLTDFGIALAESEMVDPGASLSAGSPAYASPEQLRHEPVGPPADVHGLAIAVYEALTGRLPFPDEPTQAALLQRQLHDPIPPVRSSRTDLPVAVDEVLQQATAKRAQDRHQTVEQFLAAFDAAVGAKSVTPARGTATVVQAPERNPYKGLRAFDEADAGDFAGRERLVDQLVTELTDNRLLAVVGPSGSGKSSAVRAGLLPALRRGAAPGSADWFVTTLFPGAHPDEELEAALMQIAVTRPPGLLDVLRDGDRGISRALRQVLPPQGQMLLVIDQFEEIFTLCTDEPERRRFLDGLAAAVTEERSRLHVVVTLRADFYDRPLRYEAIGRLVRDATVPVLPLAADELEQAITRPAHSVGVEFAPGLISEIVADVSDQPGALPLMQYALTELYERRVSNLVTRDAYEAIGRVTGALAARAEELHETSSSEERAEMRRLFGRLVTLGEGTEDTRRRVTLHELGSSPTTEQLIDRFGKARLLSFDRDPGSCEPTVEVAHEALLREWPRLRRWLDDDRDGLRIHRHLTETSAAWIVSGRDSGELYRGARLDGASTWVADHGGDLNDAEREFLGASVSQRTAEEAAEREHLDQQVRSNRRLRMLVAAASVIALIAAIAGVFALQQRSRADDEATDARAQAEQADQSRRTAEDAQAEAAASEAEARRQEDQAEERSREAEQALEAEAEARRSEDIQRVRASAFEVAEQNPTLALLLAAEAHRMDPGRDSQSALHRLLSDTGGLEATMNGIYGDLWLIDDGRTAVAAGFDGLDFWDLETRQRTRTIDRPSQVRTRRDLSVPALLAVFTDGSGTGMFDVVTGERVWALDTEAVDLAFSPSGAELALAFGDRLEIWDVSDPSRPAVSTTVPGGSRHVAWSPSGTELLIVTDDGAIHYHERTSLTVLWSTTATGADARADVGADARARADNPRTLFGSDGSTVVVAQLPPAGSGHAVRAFSTVDGEQLTEATTRPGNNVLEMEWLDEAALHVSITINPGGLGTFDLNTGEPIEAPYRSDAVWSIDYSPALDRIIEAGILGVQIRHPLGASPLERILPPTIEQGADDGQFVFLHQSLSADGERLLVSREAPPFAVVEYDLTVEPATYSVTDLTGIAIGENGYTMLGNPFNGSMTMLDHDLQPLGVPSTISTDFRYAQASPQGGFYVVFLADGHFDLHRSTGELVAQLRVPGAEPSDSWADLSFSSDESQILIYLISGNEAWAYFDTETGELIREGDPELLVKPLLVDGTLYAERPDDRFAVVRLDPATLEPKGDPLVGHTSGRSLAISGGASGLIATTSFDGTARVWDAETGDQVGSAIDTPAWHIQFGADGTLLSTLHPGHVAVWNFDTETWPEIACEVAGRNMTEEEWEEFGPGTIDYRATCSQFELDT